MKIVRHNYTALGHMIEKGWLSEPYARVKGLSTYTGIVLYTTEQREYNCGKIGLIGTISECNRDMGAEADRSRLEHIARC